MSARAYLSLGSNLGSRSKNLNSAITLLRNLGEITARSSFYKTEPVEFTAQPWFVNCAVRLDTELAPHELLAAILAIEQKMGRHRRQKKGPRNIDIDILLFGNAILEDADLTIPHPEMHRRRFVLEPLAEIDSELHHPGLRRSIGDLLTELPAGQAVCKIGVG